MSAHQIATLQGVAELLGVSPAAETARAYVARASDTRDPALIAAERGLDALAVCRAIHGGSDLTEYSFVPVDCRGLTPDAFERELTSVTPRRTIVMSNLDELPSPLQHRLAERLQGNEANLGPADARVMATVTGNVEDAVAERKLSRNLCRRFPLQLEVPPLRRRPADLPMLIACVAAEAAGASGVTVPSFSREALALLAALPWRRNFEELREVLDVLVLAAEGGAIQLDDVLRHVPIERLWTRPPGAESLREARHHFEREYIAAVLSRHRGRMDEAARALGVQRTNLYRKVRQLGIGRARAR
ncbi:MAG TPA: helix-turn-helix domain-containing protein [Vicinamibacterales bacterium]|nr:helix-turn-helix domain-containing protein [Vicinamibacterales bacterium]